MQVLNNFPSTVFWRVFKPDDTSYLLGWTEGTIASGATLNWVEDQFTQMKMEIRNGTSYTAPLLSPPGQKFEMDALLEVSADGQLQPPAVTFATGALTQQTSKQVDFVDLLQATTDIERKVTFDISQAFSSGSDIQRAHSDSTTWSVGGKVGGEVGKKDVKGTAEVSASFSKTVSDSLQKQYSSQVTDAWSKSSSDTMSFPAGKISVVSTEWTLNVRNLTATFFGVQVPVTAVEGSSGSKMTFSSYGSVNEMPADLQQRFKS